MGKRHFKKTLTKPFHKLFESLRVRSIQFFISSSIMLITLTAMLFVGLMLYSKFNKSAEQNAIISTRQVIDQVNLNLDYYLRSMMEISDSLNDLIGYKQDIDENRLVERMNVVLDTRKDIVSLCIFSRDGGIVAGSPSYKMKDVNITIQDWFSEPVNEPANLYFSSPHVQNIFESQHNWVVSLSREVTYYKDNKKKLGVLLVDMNFSSLDQLCQKARLGKKGYIYLVDPSGNIVYHPQQQLINAGLKSENVEEVMNHISGIYFDKFNGQNRMITIQTVNFCRWRIVGIAYMDEIVTTKKEIGVFIFWTFLFGTVFVIFISAFLSAKISQPIKALEKSMKKVEEGLLDINIDVKGEAEVAKLASTYKMMLTRIRSLMDQIVLEQESKRNAEFEVLQSQINPHFLYNTLNSVVRMVESGKKEDAITMITSLSKLFRISISRGRNIITIQEELEHANHYLTIQQIRYKNKFQFEIQSQDAVLQCKTIKLILQPIIENAIYHGIEHMVDDGYIKVTAEVSDGKLLLQVSDNGAGIRSEVLENILSVRPENREGRGVGVKNVHDRIQLYYGKEYGLEFESEVDVGTTVRIRLPYTAETVVREVRNEDSGKTA
ncbi:MAG TPA: sensor histidine kinase [Clostridia bacterium]|nr:sensor histidine kinase [Clostridia bacterium]